MKLTPLAAALMEAGLRSPAMHHRAIWMPPFVYRMVARRYTQELK